MERHELGWTTQAFFPDVTDIKNHEERGDEALVRHYHRAKSLAEGALAILVSAGEARCEYCCSAEHLLAAFLDVMAIGEEAFDKARVHNQPPFVTVDEFKEMLGDRGMAEVVFIVNKDGFTANKRVRIGLDYSGKLKKANGKKNGKSKAA